MSTADISTGRARWAAIGAAIAVTLGAGTVATVDAVTSSGERSIFTPIVPCRLMDTRPASQVGDRGTPLGGEETDVVAARGVQGNCDASDLPVDATALQLNVTAVGATAPTFLSITPDGSRDSSSLNPVPGAPPTPNAITVRLDTNGAFSIFNRFGEVDVIVDVIGVYTDHDHDDRYYTKTESDDRFDTVADVDQKIDDLAATQRTIPLPASGAAVDQGAFYSASSPVGGVSLPDGGTPFLSWSFVVPDDYEPGTDLQVTVSWTAVDSACNVALRQNFATRHRLGALGVADFMTGPTTSASRGTGVGSATTYTLLDSVGDFAAGDVINFGVFRSELDDSCRFNVVVAGALVRY